MPDRIDVVMENPVLVWFPVWFRAALLATGVLIAVIAVLYPELDIGLESPDVWLLYLGGLGVVCISIAWRLSRRRQSEMLDLDSPNP